MPGGELTNSNYRLILEPVSISSFTCFLITVLSNSKLSSLILLSISILSGS